MVVAQENIHTSLLGKEVTQKSFKGKFVAKLESPEGHPRGWAGTMGEGWGWSCKNP